MSFSRDQHAHFLTSAALVSVLMSAPGTLDGIDTDHLTHLYTALLNQEQNATDAAEEECVKHLSEVISQLLDKAAKQSRTGKLWV